MFSRSFHWLSRESFSPKQGNFISKARKVSNVACIAHCSSICLIIKVYVSFGQIGDQHYAILRILMKLPAFTLLGYDSHSHFIYVITSLISWCKRATVWFRSSQWDYPVRLLSFNHDYVTVGLKLEYGSLQSQAPV